MNFSAIFHRCTDNYCYPLNNDYLEISIKTGYDIDKVTLYYLDPFTTGIMGSNSAHDGNAQEFTDVLRLEHHLFWKMVIKPPFKRVAYYFLIESGDEKYFMYENRFFTPDEFKKYKGRHQAFMYPWINPVDVFKTPDWVTNTVWYQIFVERFCNGNPSISPENVKDWRSADKSVKYNDFFGGDIPGITSKLDYLSNLGITGLYLTPICASPSNHKYNTISYTKIDPHFGTDDDMKHMVSEAHKRGIRVMMDGVFNHSGDMFKPWQDVVKNGPASKYYDWFCINQWPFSNFGTNSKTGKYYTFGFFDGMPKLNTSNPKVIKYIIKVVSEWIKKYDIDGIRLDVANEVSHHFCKELRLALRAIKPDFYILGEIWNDSIPWLHGDEFDSVMNYSFGDALTDFITDKKMTALNLEHAINRCFTMYPKQVNRVLFNLLDSHDTERLMTKLKSASDFCQILSLLFTLPGSVCIYYGTEIAMEGGPDPDCRRCMPWKEIFKGDYYDKISFTKELINLRKTHPALVSTIYKFDEAYEDTRIISIKKTSEDSSNPEEIVITLNCDDKVLPIDIDKNSILFSTGYNDKKLSSGGILIYNIH